VADVAVTLTSDEALVLFELLHRWEDAGAVDAALRPGQQVALWALSGRLESILVEPFDAHHQDLVNDASGRLTGRDGVRRNVRSSV
jgi:hypothetical protein